ncbi:putative thioredoxin-like protein [Lupinus albus]|uniref:Putative thioredoxin-like protein n=1 Tax=Lupinus albus TaxID=3870 RepID=A0A6A4QKS7_LUPAL|nr:putative thioredoxin-like protein [Lupinus albus]
MWRPWEKSTVHVHTTSSSPSHSSSQLFSCSSFKDIQTLFLDEPPQQSSPSPTTKPSIFHRVRLANSILRTWSTHLPPQQPPKLTRTLSNSQPDPVQVQPQHRPPKSRSLSQPIFLFQPELGPDSSLSDSTPFIPGTEQRVVVYYTSLRVVRATYDACKSVFSILSGFRVRVDDRDVSMDSGFTVELNRIMGQTGLTLPRVFIGGRYIGGAEEVKQLNEIGELKKMLEKLPVADLSECHVCGGHRFVLCNECDGSRKVYTEKIGFKTCNNCNENGLLRCPSCFSTPLLSSLDLTK